MKVRCIKGCRSGNIYTEGKIYNITKNGLECNDNYHYCKLYADEPKKLVEVMNETFYMQFELVEEKENTMKVYSKKMLEQMNVERVIFNNRATIVFLKNGNKGVAVCSEDDHNDPVVGFSVAYAVAVGTNGNKKQFKENVVKLEKRG